MAGFSATLSRASLLPTVANRLVGNTGNVWYVTRYLGRLMQSINHVNSVELTILSSLKALQKVDRVFHSFKSLAKSDWSLKLIEWDDSKQPQQLEEALGSAHFAWIPSNPNDALKAGVSHNRLVDAVRSGCIPVASEMPAIEMSKVALIGSDHGNLINIASQDYQRLALKHNGFRTEALAAFSPEINIKSWVQLLRRLSSTH